MALIVAHGNGTGLAGQISGWGKTPDCWNGRVANVGSSKNRNSFQELQPDWISRRLIEYRLLFFFFGSTLFRYIFFKKKKFLFQWDGKIKPETPRRRLTIIGMNLNRIFEYHRYDYTNFLPLDSLIVPYREGSS